MKLIKYVVLAVTAASLAVVSSCCPPKPAPTQPAYVAPTK
jgi:hypothetical protein